MKRKALASDFDGTLFFHSGPDTGLRQEDMAAIRSFRAEGGRFGICTGRSVNSIIKELKDHTQADFYICTSGALLLDGSGMVLRCRPMDKAPVRELYDTWHDRAKGIVFHDGWDVYAVEPYFPWQRPVDSVDSIPRPVLQVSLGFEDRQTAIHAAAEINSRYNGILDAYPNVINVDIVAHGVSKGEALTEMKALLGAEVMGGIGDGHNDLPMLQAADVSFTFPDSPAEVRAAADHLVDSVAQALHILTDQ